MYPMDNKGLGEHNFREFAQEMIEQHAKDGQIIASLVWGRIVGLYEAKLSKCKACSIEAEFGTEEDPHPIHLKFHTCYPL